MKIPISSERSSRFMVNLNVLREQIIARLPIPVKSGVKTVLKINTLNDFYMSLTGKKKPETLWFDDGSLEDFTLIYPLLKRYNLVGVLAIVTEWIGHEGFMNLEQIRAMVNDGWKVASHSVTHRYFKQLSSTETEKELVNSKKWIQKNLGVQPFGFMPPYGINEMREDQRKLALRHYSFICRESRHFHSIHLRERSFLEKILHDIDLKSPFWKAELDELSLPPKPPLAEGYDFIKIRGKDVSEHLRRGYERLQETEWNVPSDACAFFILKDNEVVGTEWAYFQNGVGTLHSAVVNPEHRKKGFYQLMSLSGLEYLMANGISVVELHTNVKILWHFWERLGFRRVAEVQAHARSGWRP